MALAQHHAHFAVLLDGGGDKLGTVVGCHFPVDVFVATDNNLRAYGDRVVGSIVLA